MWEGTSSCVALFAAPAGTVLYRNRAAAQELGLEVGHNLFSLPARALRSPLAPVSTFGSLIEPILPGLLLRCGTGAAVAAPLAEFAPQTPTVAAVAAAAETSSSSSSSASPTPAPTRAASAQLPMMSAMPASVTMDVQFCLPTAMRRATLTLDRQADGVSWLCVAVLHGSAAAAVPADSEESERHVHSLILDQLPSSVIVLDRAGRCLLWNKSAERAFQYCAEERVGEYLWKYNAPSQGFITSVVSAVFDGRSVSGEHVCEGKDHTSIPLLFGASPVRDPAGRIVAAAVVTQDHSEYNRQRQAIEATSATLMRDVGERTAMLEREAEAKKRLQTELELLSLVTQKSHHAVLVVDPQHRIVWSNEAFVQLSGLSADAVRGRPLSELLIAASNQSNSVSSASPGSSSNGDSITTTTAAADGNAVTAENGGGVQLLVAPFSYVVHRSGRRVAVDVEVTRRATDGDAAGAGSVHSVVLLMEAADRLKMQEAMQRANREALANELKTEYVTTLSHEIRTPLHGIIGMSSVLLRSDLRDVDEVRRSLEIVLGCSEVLMTLLNNVLDMRKIEAGQMQIRSVPFELRAALQQSVVACTPVASQKGVIISCDCDPQAPERCLGDPTRLRQILINLLSNAIKFSPVKGIVQVCVRLLLSSVAVGGASTPPVSPKRLHSPASTTNTAAASTATPLSTSSSQAGEVRRSPPVVLQFSVRDLGAGIPVTKLDRLFQRFSQLEHAVAGAEYSTTAGSGLGLVICKRLVEMMNGRIWVESEPGRGSIFYFSVPLIPLASIEGLPSRVDGGVTAASASPQPPMAALAARAVFRILIVEDNLISQKVLCKQLHQLGFRDLEVVEDGQEAVPRVLSRVPPFDLVFMDRHMPKLHGLEATARICDVLWPRQPLIVGLTADVLKEDLDRCLEVGMDDCLCKPVSFERMQQVMESAMRDRQALLQKRLLRPKPVPSAQLGQLHERPPLASSRAGVLEMSG